MSEHSNGPPADGSMTDPRGNCAFPPRESFQAPSWDEMFTIIETAQDLLEAVKGFFGEIALDNPMGVTIEVASYLSNLLCAAIRLRDMFGPLRDVQRPSPVGWPPAVRVQLNILHNRVDELCTELELNTASSEALDYHRSGGAKGDGSIAIRLRPAWTGHEVGYASIAKAAFHLFDELKYIDWKIANPTESALLAYRPPNAALALLPNHVKALLTSCRELALARITAAATEAPAGPPDLVTLNQAASYVKRSKQTLEHYKKRGDIPPPMYTGGKGKPDLWDWRTLRPCLERLYNMKLPVVFPANLNH